MATLDLLKRIFIDPIMRTRPSTVDETAYAKYVFSTSTRILSLYRAKDICKVPGTYLINGVHPGIKSDEPLRCRHLAKKGQILVRIDDSTGVIEVDNKGQVFRLTQDQWNTWRPSLILYKGNEEL